MTGRNPCAPRTGTEPRCAIWPRVLDMETNWNFLEMDQPLLIDLFDTDPAIRGVTMTLLRTGLGKFFALAKPKIWTIEDRRINQLTLMGLAGARASTILGLMEHSLEAFQYAAAGAELMSIGSEDPESSMVLVSATRSGFFVTLNDHLKARDGSDAARAWRDLALCEVDRDRNWHRDEVNTATRPNFSRAVLTIGLNRAPETAHAALAQQTRLRDDLLPYLAWRSALSHLRLHLHPEWSISMRQDA